MQICIYDGRVGNNVKWICQPSNISDKLNISFFFLLVRISIFLFDRFFWGCRPFFIWFCIFVSWMEMEIKMDDSNWNGIDAGRAWAHEISFILLSLSFFLWIDWWRIWNCVAVGNRQKRFTFKTKQKKRGREIDWLIFKHFPYVHCCLLKHQHSYILRSCAAIQPKLFSFEYYSQLISKLSVQRFCIRTYDAYVWSLVSLAARTTHTRIWLIDAKVIPIRLISLMRAENIVRNGQLVLLLRAFSITFVAVP